MSFRSTVYLSRTHTTGHSNQSIHPVCSKLPWQCHQSKIKIGTVVSVCHIYLAKHTAKFIALEIDATTTQTWPLCTPSSQNNHVLTLLVLYSIVGSSLLQSGAARPFAKVLLLPNYFRCSVGPTKTSLIQHTLAGSIN